MEKTLHGLSTENFSLYYDCAINENEKIAQLLEYAYCHFHSRFGANGFRLSSPEEKLRWVVFDDQDSFNSYAFRTENQDLSWLSGYYSARTNQVAIVVPNKIANWQVMSENYPTREIIACPPDAETDLAKVIHEVAHQLSFNCSLQKRGNLYPLWAGEGLAMSFERSFLIEHFKSSRYTNIRAKRLAGLYRKGELIALNSFISMSRLGGTRNPIDVYAQAWGFFQFLCNRKPEALSRYFETIYNQKPGYRDPFSLRKEFIRAFGSIDELEVQWLEFLENLPSSR